MDTQSTSVRILLCHIVSIYRMEERQRNGICNLRFEIKSHMVYTLIVYICPCIIGARVSYKNGWSPVLNQMSFVYEPFPKVGKLWNTLSGGCSYFFM